MSAGTPFKPRRGGNKKVTATTTSATVTIGAGEKSVRIINAGAVVGYFVIYNSKTDTALTADATQTPIAVAGAAGSVLVVEKGVDDDTIAYASDSSTAVLHFQAGEGGS